MTSVLRDEGVPGLYRGVTPNMWGAGAAWGLYFMLLVFLITVSYTSSLGD